MSNTQNRAKHPAPPTLVPDEITPDPHPERLSSLGGVRQHNQHAATELRELPSVTARRPSHPFGASILITVAGQGLLAAVIARGTISPVIGAIAAIGLLICGLLLIVAAILTAGRR